MEKVENVKIRWLSNENRSSLLDGILCIIYNFFEIKAVIKMKKGVMKICI